MQWNSGGITTWSGPLFGYRHPQSTQIVARHLLSLCAQEYWLYLLNFPAATEALRRILSCAAGGGLQGDVVYLG
jgi:hypothetical protein